MVSVRAYETCSCLRVLNTDCIEPSTLQNTGPPVKTIKSTCVRNETISYMIYATAKHSRARKRAAKIQTRLFLAARFVGTRLHASQPQHLWKIIGKVLLICLPSDKVQHELQRRSLINIPPKNKKKTMGEPKQTGNLCTKSI